MSLTLLYKPRANNLPFKFMPLYSNSEASVFAYVNEHHILPLVSSLSKINERT